MHILLQSISIVRFTREGGSYQVCRYVFLSGGSPSLQSTVQVTINIADLNDNTPSITPSSYIAGVMENLPSGQSVLRVSIQEVFPFMAYKALCSDESVVLDPFSLNLVMFSLLLELYD